MDRARRPTLGFFSQNLHATHTNLAKSSGGPYVAADLAQSFNCAQLWYLDDGNLVGPVEVLAAFMNSISDPDSPHFYKNRTGMELNVDKCVLWTLRSAFPGGDIPLWGRDLERVQPRQVRIEHV